MDPEGERKINCSYYYPGWDKNKTYTWSGWTGIECPHNRTAKQCCIDIIKKRNDAFNLGGRWHFYNRYYRRSSDPLKDKFMKWYNMEIKDLSWASGLPACPCKMANAYKVKICEVENYRAHDVNYSARVVDTGRIEWRYDPYNPDSDIWEGPTDLTLTAQNVAGLNYHPGARYELRTKSSYSKHGQQCTYDNTGRLITHGLDAGTADKSSERRTMYGAYLFEGIHEPTDVEPYDWAMELDGYPAKPRTYLKMYLEVRPQNNGNNCPENP